MTIKDRKNVWIRHFSMSNLCRHDHVFFLYMKRVWSVVTQIQQYLYQRIFLSIAGTSHSHFRQINMQRSFIYKANKNDFNSYFSIAGYCRE